MKNGAGVPASRWSRGLLLLRVLALLAAFQPFAHAGGAPPVEECEAALGRLITILESRQQLSGSKYIYAGAPLATEYSKCRVTNQGRLWPAYVLYRSTDNVSVVVEKTAGQKETPVLYGPFASAYRK